MDEKELLARVDESTKSAHKRIDRLESTIEDIRELTFGVKEIATEVKLMREDFQKLDERVSSIEKEPIDEFKDIKKQIRNSTISVIMGAVIGAIITLLLKWKELERWKKK